MPMKFRYDFAQDWQYSSRDHIRKLCWVKFSKCEPHNPWIKLPKSFDLSELENSDNQDNTPCALLVLCGPNYSEENEYANIKGHQRTFHVMELKIWRTLYNCMRSTTMSSHIMHRLC